MNHRDRQTLGTLLDQLWDTRDGHKQRKSGIVEFDTGKLTSHQRQLLAAAMRIVDGTTDGSELPDPWPSLKLHKLGTPREPYAETVYRRWLRIFR
jgi:hypothetical protein